MGFFRKTLQGYRIALAIFFIVLACWTIPVKASTPAPDKPVYIYLFWGDGCPHCAAAKPFFEGLHQKYPSVVLKTFEVYYNKENQLVFLEMAQKYGLEQLGVPTYFIGPHGMQGYAESLNQDIENLVRICIRDGCIDPGVVLTSLPAEGTPATPEVTGSFTARLPETTISPTSTLLPPVLALATPTREITAGPIPTAVLPSAEDPGILSLNRSLDVPLIGKVDLSSQSITFSTILIAIVDGINPCSLWVLSMLLALTLHTGSRKRVFLIGMIFLTVTSIIYGLFIIGLFSILKIASFLGWIQNVVGLVALFFALVNIKDYFWYKEGFSLTIADEKKPGIYRQMRKLMDTTQSFWGLAGATVVFAAGVSLVEFSCTAGFPVLWTNIVVSQGVTALTFILLLVLYLVIYQLDELIIFTSAVVSLKASKLEEKHGRILKLIGGMLMLTLALVMLFKPALMNTLESSLLIFGSAITATLLFLFFHRIVLPKFGWRIGTELSPSPIAEKKPIDQ